MSIMRRSTTTSAPAPATPGPTMPQRPRRAGTHRRRRRPSSPGGQDRAARSFESARTKRRSLLLEAVQSLDALQDARAALDTKQVSALQARRLERPGELHLSRIALLQTDIDQLRPQQEAAPRSGGGSSRCNRERSEQEIERLRLSVTPLHEKWAVLDRQEKQLASRIEDRTRGAEARAEYIAAPTSTIPARACGPECLPRWTRALICWWLNSRAYAPQAASTARSRRSSGTTWTADQRDQARPPRSRYGPCRS